MSEYLDVDGDGSLDQVEYEQYEDGSVAAFVDLNHDGYADIAAVDVDGDGNIDRVVPLGGNEGGYQQGNEQSSNNGYPDNGNFYANDNLGTAVSSNGNGDGFYYVNTG